MILVKRIAAAVPKIPWIPAAALVAWLGWAIPRLDPDFISRHSYLRTGLLVAGLALCFSLDDPAAPTVGPAPSPLRTRTWTRIGVSLIPWSLLFTALIWAGASGGLQSVWTVSASPQTPELPVGRLLLEAGTIGCLGLALAAVSAKRWSDEPGMVSSAVLLALFAASWAIPEPWSPWATPNDPTWSQSWTWWSTALAATGFVLISSTWDSRRWPPNPSRWLSRRRVDTDEQEHRLASRV